MRIYLSGAWPRRADVARAAARLEARGHTVAHRWFDAPPGASIDYNALEGFAGVAECDVVVALAADAGYAYAGTLFEIGMAVALRTPVVALLPSNRGALRRCPFVMSDRVERVVRWYDLEERLHAIEETLSAPCQ